MDELFSGDVTHLAENKASLQESFDSLQSACNLTEIVMKDKGVEMLLLKKEIQGKMDHLLDGALPPEPPDLKQLDIRFVPGEVKLGDVLLPGEEVVEVDELKKDGEKVWANGVPNGDIGSELSSSSRPSNGSDAGSESCVKSCKECVERKRKIEKEQSQGSKDKDKDKVRKEKEEEKGVGVGGESRRATKSVYIQTLPQDGPAAGGDRRSGGYFTTTASQVSLTPSGISVSHSAMQTHTATVSSRHAGTDSAYNHNNNNTAGNRTPVHIQQQQQQQQPQNGHRARGTMTDRQDVRTLKIQTEESCLRDSHLGQAAATGSTYPNTGAAIAAAFLRHKASDEDVMTKSWSPATRGEVATTATSAGRHHTFAEVEVAKETQDAQVATDISLGLLGNTADAVAALCGGEIGGGGGGAVGRSGADASRPDLLAQTGGATTTTDAPARPPSSHSPWIRSRKVQTEISALEGNDENGGAANKSGRKFVSDAELNKSLFGSSSSTRASAALCRADSATTPSTTLSTPSTSSSSSSQLPLRRRASRAPTRDTGVMTSFKVKLVQDTEEKETSVEAATSRGVGVMTSPETRAVYIQTRGPRVTSTGTGTDYDGQMSKSTSTLHVAAVDAETAMPQVTHENRTTWTEAVVTSERATCTAGSSTSDAATLTAQIRTGDFAVQVKPQGVTASTGTDPAARLVHHQCQTSPSLCSRGTMPDPKLLALELASSSTPPPAPAPTPTPATNPSLAATPVPNPASSAASSSLEPAAAAAAVAAVVAKMDKATETVPATCVTRAVGPSSQMQSSRTASTDTLHLLQVRSVFFFFSRLHRYLDDLFVPNMSAEDIKPHIIIIDELES